MKKMWIPNPELISLGGSFIQLTNDNTLKISTGLVIRGIEKK